MLLYRLEDKRIRNFFIGGKHPRPDELRKVLHALASGPGVCRDVSTGELAEATGINEKRVRVISSALENLHVLVRRGRTRHLQRSMTSSEIDAFVASFEAHAHADREMLRTMMRYAETAACRMQFVREYFGEVPGKPCLHCDNCHRPPEKRRPAPVRKRRAQRMQESARDAVLRQGERVVHERFGMGDVLEVSGDEIKVSFPRYGERRVLSSFLRPAAMEG